jgi:hypothetical protein
MQSSTPSITVYNEDNSDTILAFEHYARLAKDTEEVVGTDYIAPPAEVFRRHQPDTEAKGKQEKAPREVHVELVSIFDDPELVGVLKTKKRKAVIMALEKAWQVTFGRTHWIAKD